MKKNVWKTKDDEVVSCEEKVKVLNENYEEIKTVIQNSFDDAILMGCDEDDFKLKIIDLIKELEFSYKK
tara:strand:- start:219 stop:425 length:207 start_codon:yes stop_codon:yes gene_type:complete